MKCLRKYQWVKLPRDTPSKPEETMFPEGLEAVHPKYAISRRNRWLVANADIVVCYITHGWGGAAQYVQQAERAGKQIINIATL